MMSENRAQKKGAADCNVASDVGLDKGKDAMAEQF
jgi:hypothetical protein